MITENRIKEDLKSKTLPGPIPLPLNHHIQLLPTRKGKIIYSFCNSYGDELIRFEAGHPTTITEQSNIGREIRKRLNPDGRLSREAVQQDFEDIRALMRDTIETYRREEELRFMEKRKKEEYHFQFCLEAARDILENKEQPLLYIASVVSWLTAGERNNIMLTFLAYASQVILGNPISVIGLGDGGSGKTHIQEVAMGLIPEQYIIHEKSITEAAMFNRAKEDPYYYDGKIVNYGDLGGRNSQDFIMEAKNLLKELQSDGFLKKPLSVPTEEGWVTQDIMLYGHPCLTYTTVPGFVFDDQEMSRSIFITPRMDNKNVYNAMKTMLEFEGGTTHKKYQYWKKEAEMVQYMVELLKEQMSEITIVNPYTESIIKFLSASEYFKRDFNKYNSILKTITSFHCFNRPTYEYEGKKILFTSLSDLQLFMSLLKPYHESINVNISPKAAEILEDLRENIDDWTLKNEEFAYGITINEYIEYTDIKLQKTSFWNYFSELNSHGLLKVVDRRGNSNVYMLTDKIVGKDTTDFLRISEMQRNVIRSEFGPNALDFILEDAVHEGLSIERQDEDVEVPGWDYYDE